MTTVKIGSVSLAVCLFSVFLLGNKRPQSSGFSYVRPMPELPKLGDPALANDIFSVSIYHQIHGKLFLEGKSSYPRNGLVSNYTVLEGGKLYRIELKRALFHKGQQLTAGIVKKSLEFSFRNITELANFYRIEGLAKFREGKSGEITGIRADKNSDRILFISLTEPDPDLTLNLAGHRLSILMPNRDPLNGLGSFKVNLVADDQIRLERNPDKKFSDRAPKTVVLKKEPELEDAISGFLEDKYSDLFLYLLDASQVKSIGKRASFNLVPFPRTYGLFANSRRLKKEQRKNLFGKLDRREIFSLCYPTHTFADGFIPFGFLGYGERVPSQSARLSKSHHSQKKYTIHVHDKIGGEKCVRSHLKALFPKSLVKIVSISESLRSWGKNDIDAFFSFIQGQGDLDFISAFIENESLFLGSKASSETVKKINREIDKSTTLSSQRSLMSQLLKVIYSDFLVLPVMHPKKSIALNSKMEPIEIGVRSAIMYPLSEMRFKEPKK